MKKRSFLLVSITILIVFMISDAQLSSNYKIIVHSSNPVSKITRDDLSKIFLKKIKIWEDGNEIHPVDLVYDSPVRKGFSNEIHHRPVSKIKAYWQMQIFSGKDVPPPQLDYEDDVMSFVKSDPGAIGYLSSGTSLNQGHIKIISITE